MAQWINGSATAEVCVPHLLSDFSLEMTAGDIDELNAAARLLPAGTEVSITFLPKDNYAEKVAAAVALRRAGLIPVPHISARRIASHVDLDRFLGAMAEQAGVDRIFIIAGDLSVPAGPFSDSLAVIESGLVQKHGIRGVGLAGHPQGHPEVPEAVLWEALLAKQKSLAAIGAEGYLVTQFAFDASPVAAWAAEVRSRGITMAIRIGVPGPANVRTLLRFAARCGVGVSTKMMARYGLSATKLLGITGPERFLDALSARVNPSEHGELRLHFYPFGGLLATTQWINDYQQAFALPALR
jgi:methylenetetrahydrofolate reductase (NADPH)